MDSLYGCFRLPPPQRRFSRLRGMQKSKEETMKKVIGLGLIHIVWPIVIAQYILAFFIYKLPGWLPLQVIGWGVWVLSAIFGIAPIFILGRRGSVPQGKSYVATTRLVDTSLYAVVRHPQYLAGILFCVSMMMVAQHGVIILLGLIASTMMYFDIQSADREGIGKFGDEYRAYMQRVPQVNFILGLLRLVRSKPSSSKWKNPPV
jgi:protein-S-isoprenylcysteine O-methyltransferase Ste14